jgi:hypothetical protein
MFSSRTGRARFNILSVAMRHNACARKAPERELAGPDSTFSLFRCVIMRVLVRGAKIVFGTRRQGPNAILWVGAKNSLFAGILLKSLTIFPGFAHCHPGLRRSFASHFIEKPRDFFCHRPRPPTVKQGAPSPGFSTLPTRENIRLCEAGDAGSREHGAWRLAHERQIIMTSETKIPVDSRGRDAAIKPASETKVDARGDQARLRNESRCTRRSSPPQKRK